MHAHDARNRLPPTPRPPVPRFSPGSTAPPPPSDGDSRFFVSFGRYHDQTDERSACRGVPGDQVILVRENDELYPVAQAELGQHRADVGLDRGLAEELAPRDLRVAQ